MGKANVGVISEVVKSLMRYNVCSGLAVFSCGEYGAAYENRGLGCQIGGGIIVTGSQNARISLRH